MMTLMNMISNSIIGIRLNKHRKEDPERHFIVVDYATNEDAEASLAKESTLNGVVLDKEYGKGSHSKDKPFKKSFLNHKSKVYIGNLPESMSTEELKKTLPQDLSFKSVFVSKASASEKKYAFLEFENETERNMALGLLEKVKKDGAFGSDTVLSPAYPYSQGSRHNSHRHQ
ncbi:hypothetical protein NEOKW01_0831 [Nematocida sp. AWRm80]|nr:hypothetical protein NEOKW01_0831 [Nematocida sp. AWRm80]